MTFVDYSAAFDTVSHKFIDKALAEAGATQKTRAMFRAIYKSASAKTEVEGTDGKVISSDVFQVNRGVVQGDITSPWYFILALELILRTHDTHPDKGVQFGGKTIYTLGYADDAALIDSNLEVATARVSAIAQGSKADADMTINTDKTETMHVAAQDKVTRTTNTEAVKVCKFVCKNVGCDMVFYNAHGAKCHAGRCKWKRAFEMEKILEVKGSGAKRKFLVRWQGYGPAADTWEPHKNLPPAAVKEFLQQNGHYDYEWPADSRCPHCDVPCKSPRGVKIHMRKCQHRPVCQKFVGTCADAKVKDNKMQAAQESKPQVSCAGTQLQNVSKFKYLGSIYAADGSQIHDVKRRVALAMSRCGALNQVFNSKDLNLTLKIDIYRSAVTSLLTYGSEAWNLNPSVTAKLNGANARCLSRITGKSAHVEASRSTRTYDLVAAIRRRRFKWLGHLLRLPDERLVKLAVRVQYEMNLPGNICSDAPPTSSFDELVKFAKDRKTWMRRCPSSPRIRQHTRTTGPCTRSQALSTNDVGNNGDTTTTTATATPCTPPKPTTAKQYRERDAFEALFKPKAKTAKKAKAIKKGVPVKNERKALTQKQRVANARAHYIVHHGNAEDAVRFLRNEQQVTNTPCDLLTELKQMCVIPAPAWAVAEAAIFSSSESSLSINTSLMTPNTNSGDDVLSNPPVTVLSPTGSPYQPPNWLPRRLPCSPPTPKTRLPSALTTPTIDSPQAREREQTNGAHGEILRLAEMSNIWLGQLISPPPSPARSQQTTPQISPTEAPKETERPHTGTPKVTESANGVRDEMLKLAELSNLWLGQLISPPPSPTQSQQSTPQRSLTDTPQVTELANGAQDEMLRLADLSNLWLGQLISPPPSPTQSQQSDTQPNDIPFTLHTTVVTNTSQFRRPPVRFN